MPRVVQIAVELLKKLDRASEALVDLRDAFEDYLIATNPSLLKKLRRARRDDLAGRTRPFEELRRELSLD